MSTLHSNSAAENCKVLLSIWSKARESQSNVLNPAMYKRPTAISRPKTSLFSLLIGINVYHSETLRSLQGAVSDALAFKEYLETNLAILTENIQTLIDSSATCSAIIEVLVCLRDNFRISKGDPILIFYVGYGSDMLLSEPPLITDRCIVPYDYSEGQGHEDLMIGHQEIASLVSQIVKTKGDNITFIFDCFYSPFAGQKADECSPTHMWSAQLNSLGPSSDTNVSSLDVVSWIDRILGQTPQCISHSTSRSLFNAKVASECDHTIFNDANASVIALQEENDKLRRKQNDLKVALAQKRQQSKDQREDFTGKLKSLEEELARAKEGTRGVQVGGWPGMIKFC